jgi:hypothetical protein
VRYQAALRPDQPTLGFPSKQSQDVLQSFADAGEDFVAVRPLRPSGLGELLPRARDRESAIVQKFFDSKDVLDILLLIYAMTGLGFFRRKVWKFRFPKAKDVGFNTHDFANFTDLKEEFVGNF